MSWANGSRFTPSGKPVERAATAVAVADDRTEWLQWRRGGIGASDVAAILGISRWQSPWSVWADKVGLLPLDHDQTIEQEAGQWLELSIRPWFAHRTGLHVDCAQERCVHPTDPIARCTIDGKVYESPHSADPVGLVEVKTTGPGRPWAEIPAYYQAQGQWQMHVTGLDRVWFPVLMGRRLDIHELERDQADIDFMVERVHDFWANHVAAGVPPEPDGSDATLDAIARVWPEHQPGRTVDLDDKATVVDRWRDAIERERAAKEDRQACAAVIQAALGDAEEGLVDGVRVVTWRRQTRTVTCPGGCGHTQTSSFRVLRDAARKKGAAA